MFVKNWIASYVLFALLFDGVNTTCYRGFILKDHRVNRVGMGGGGGQLVHGLGVRPGQIVHRLGRGLGHMVHGLQSGRWSTVYGIGLGAQVVHNPEEVGSGDSDGPGVRQFMFWQSGSQGGRVSRGSSSRWTSLPPYGIMTGATVGILS